MHARIEQLLSLRDGEPVDASVRIHVQHCEQCAADLARVERAREALCALPAFDPPADAWSQIAAQAPQRPAHRASWAFAATAAAAFVAIAAFVVTSDTDTEPQLAQQQLHAASPAQTREEDTESLIAQSRELDALLHDLPQRPQVERVALAATVDSIEERIQLLDWQLAFGSDAGLDRQQSHRLWSERVELMDSLVKVRYAESAPMTL